MPVVLARIDQRFIHGQILASGALARRRVTGVIVADRALCGDETRKRIFDGALTAADPPVRRGAVYVDPSRICELLDAREVAAERYLAIFGDMAGVLAALDAGAALDALNLGNFCSSADDRSELYQGFTAGPSEIAELDELARRVRQIYFGPLDDPHMCYRPHAPSPGRPPCPGPGGQPGRPRGA
ncbi:MAG: PTS sugar transporter subunit IIB [Deltaproteobacteria bacterium]|jgi:mannose/fructose/N-acetylgalactosamine-specific phosphotransferase system component IIB|nr:PTS sugar transporter subunit IIB [Deltaproteobacteria bacterium]